METSQKPQARPRVVYGPHRLRVSGGTTPSAMPAQQVIATVGASDFEIVTTAIEISSELIPLEEPNLAY